MSDSIFKPEDINRPTLPVSPDTPKNADGVPYDPQWYTWSRLMKCFFNKCSFEETMQYVHMHSLKHGESQCKRCDERTAWMFRHSPIVRFMQDKIGELGVEISEKNILCKICNSLSTNEQAEGAFSKKYGILLCANHLGSKGQQEDVMAHEMIHAYDHVRFQYDGDNLRHRACTEIRAATLSGECRWLREFWSNGNYFKFTMHFQDCVRRRAVNSLLSHPKCKDDVEAVKTVNAVWDSCFSDTRPFDEIYR